MPDSIKSAADLVNNILFARGYEQEPLLFSTINNDDLQTPDQIHANDKLVINTIYALLQELDHTKAERQHLSDQLADKTEIIKHYQDSNRELHSDVSRLQREVINSSNESTVLKQSIKSLKHEKLLQDGHLQSSKNVNNSLKVKYEVEMKKKSIQIERLQDRLLNKRSKYQSIIERNNHSIKEDTPNNKLTIDDEMELMMINLSDLIASLTVQNDIGLKLLNFIHSYLILLTDTMMQRNVSLPPTPKFFYDNMSSSDTTPMESFKPLIIQTLERLYDLIHSDINVSNDDEKVINLQNEITTLQKNLEIAMETNEKWSKRFNKS